MSSSARGSRGQVISVLLGPDNGHGRRARPIRTGRRDKPVIHLPSIALRVMIVVGVAAALFGVILFRLWFLQILSGQEFIAEANDNRLRSVRVAAPRGSIVDRRGKVIVENRPGLAVGLRLMDVPQGTLDAEVVDLARVLRMKPDEIREDIMDHLAPSWPVGDGAPEFTWENVVKGVGVSLDLVVLKQDASMRIVSYLKEHTLSFPGVEIQQDYLRAYPLGDFAAHLLGNLGEISGDELESKHFKGYRMGDVVGQAGVEYTYDRWLRGRDGIAKIEVDAFGRPKQSSPVAGGRLPEPGDTLVMTLDAKVQKAAESALRYGLSLAYADGKVEANGGAAVAMNVKNGEILGMASYPTFDPDVWVGGISEKNMKALSKKRANYPLINRAIQETKAVGSTFKPVDAIAALEEGVIEPSDSFFCDGSYIAPNTLDRHIFWCWVPGGHGSVDVVTALTESCDIFFYNVGYRFYTRKGTELQDWASRLGMGKPTGVDVPGEASGRVPTWQWKKTWPGFKTEIDRIWKPGDSIMLAVGQGDMEATPLQLAVAYSAIANGGTIVTPHLGLRVVDAVGQTVRELPARPARKVDMAPGTLDLVRRGLYDAANSPAGTSFEVFYNYGVKVAGKTGTAEVWDSTRSGYVDYAWYASYAPADDPKYAVVVMIEKGGHGGTVAAPAARLIYDSLFGLDSGEFTGTVRSD